jgi:predicted O-linked N-acetylglucosamine transferase (SPINDLY family)
MAASLLHAIDAPRRITFSLSQYVATAVRHAHDPADYVRCKALFTDHAWQRTIGDIGVFTKEFEDTWYRMTRSRADI